MNHILTMFIVLAGLDAPRAYNPGVSMQATEETDMNVKTRGILKDSLVLITNFQKNGIIISINNTICTVIHILVYENNSEKEESIAPTGLLF